MIMVVQYISDDVTVTINKSPIKPQVSLNGKTTICEGEKVQLSSNAVNSNAWFKVGSSSIISTMQGIEVDTTGEYYVKVTGTNGCGSLSERVSVIMIKKPEIPTIGIDSKEFCNGDSSKLSVTTNLKTQWYFNGLELFGGNKTTYYVKNAGVYSVKISTDEGCSSSSNAVDIVVKPTTEIPSIIPNGLPSICQGSTLLLTSSVNANNVWYKNGVKVGTGQFLNVTDSGFYKVTAMRTNMCMSQSDLLKVTVNKAPSIPIITRNQTELVSNYTSGNQWYSSDGSSNSWRI